MSDDGKLTWGERMKNEPAVKQQEDID